MAFLSKSIFAGVILYGAVLPVPATTLLDDTFADGSRSIQNLPVESAWYASSGSSLIAAPGAMTLTLGGSAILGVTYFTSNSASPVSLNIGDTLTANITFTFNGIAPLNTAQGFRIALCDFGTNRASADFSSSSSQGANVPGYALFQNMGGNFNNATPMDIFVRTVLSDKSSWERAAIGHLSPPARTAQIISRASPTMYNTHCNYPCNGPTSVQCKSLLHG